MKLELNELDLIPAARWRTEVRFEHFLPSVQAAIRAVGRGYFAQSKKIGETQRPQNEIVEKMNT